MMSDRMSSVDAFALSAIHEENKKPNEMEADKVRLAYQNMLDKLNFCLSNNLREIVFCVERVPRQAIIEFQKAVNSRNEEGLFATISSSCRVTVINTKGIAELGNCAKFYM